MRMAAQILGVVWMAAVALSAIVLLSSGTLRGGRGNIYLLFAAAFPGILIFRWGRNSPLRNPFPARKPVRTKAPLDKEL
jgi:hypothetical protein